MGTIVYRRQVRITSWLISSCFFSAENSKNHLMCQMCSGYSVGSRYWREREYQYNLCIFFSLTPIIKRVKRFIAFNFQTECDDPEKLIEVSCSLAYWLLRTEAKQQRRLTEDLRRWRRRGSGSGWTSEGLCLKRPADTGTSWPWPTTSPSGWKPSPWSPACLRMWPNTLWTSLLTLGSRSESCPGCLTTSSRRWV